ATDAVPTGNTYDKYGTSNPVERRIMAGFLRALDTALPPAGVSSVLEVGVGEGDVSERVRSRYPAASVVGVDLPDETLAAEWAQRNLHNAFASASRLPFADRRFDLVLAIEVLEHVPDPAAALTEIARVAKDAVVLSVPCEPLWRVLNLARGKYVRDLGNTPGHIQHWGPRSFSRLVGEYLDVTEVHRPLPWTMVAARRRSG
ncbi:MAG: class I SAM-dependent methyltransferase, partial [Actinobacteria bacterium]|nr:class I SAM-dependent methyltransferase [Actinomycetota bacterium]